MVEKLFLRREIRGREIGCKKEFLRQGDCLAFFLLSCFVCLNAVLYLTRALLASTAGGRSPARLVDRCAKWRDHASGACLENNGARNDHAMCWQSVRWRVPELQCLLLVMRKSLTSAGTREGRDWVIVECVVMRETRSSRAACLLHAAPPAAPLLGALATGLLWPHNRVLYPLSYCGPLLDSLTTELLRPYYRVLYTLDYCGPTSRLRKCHLKGAEVGTGQNAKEIIVPHQGSAFQTEKRGIDKGDKAHASKCPITLTCMSVLFVQRRLACGRGVDRSAPSGVPANNSHPGRKIEEGEGGRGIEKKILRSQEWCVSRDVSLADLGPREARFNWEGKGGGEWRGDDTEVLTGRKQHFTLPSWVFGGIVVRLLTSCLDEPCAILDGVTPGISVVWGL
ncbi:hypothetical protein PR048_019435 [Dryococelus australis]|uniref:Uncharacterized protein n=1 Tax=Dryococelus australis TaxID=614101 RepID=A0ABQ9H3H3_9NEOP|nr:hypothetical protein PR048_019435 [Dryococelus australis]